MKTRFFKIMEQIEKKSKQIKNLESQNSEEKNLLKYCGEADMLLFSLENIEKRIIEDMKK